jgi:hypothetical protein
MTTAVMFISNLVLDILPLDFIIKFTEYNFINANLSKHITPPIKNIIQKFYDVFC